MIPLQLTIEGLYSYQQRQTIDFDKLTQAGLFGIFGAVGSGKSSILEAISYALYGETERLNGRDNRAYNMMNLKSNRSYIAFDFLNFENRKFRATRELKRNSKNFDDVKAFAVFYEWKNDGWETLETTKADDIIDLTYANFKRTIIIPQGQFKEFLELGAKDRTEMMKEIFRLHRFDLQHKVTSLTTENKTLLDRLEGQLQGFEHLSHEQILTQKNVLAEENSCYQMVLQQFKNVEEQYRIQKNVKTDFELLTRKKEEFKILEDQQEFYRALAQKTDIFEKTHRLFQPLLTEQSKMEKAKREKTRLREDQMQLVDVLQKQFDALQKELAEVLPQFHLLDTSKTRAQDLELIVQMLGYSQEILTLSERTEKGNQKVEEVEKEQLLMSEKSAVAIKNLEDLKQKRIDAHLLLQVGNWFSLQKNYEESLKNQNQKLTDCTHNISKIAEEIAALSSDPDRYQEDFRLKSEALETEKKVLNEKRSHLNVQQQLEKYSSALHDGAPCPLCGALEHPHIVVFADIATELKNLQQQIEHLEQRQLLLHKESVAFEKSMERKKIFEDQLQTEKEACSKITSAQALHRQNFIWKQFSPEKEAEFEQLRTDAIELEKSIENLSAEISELQQRSNAARDRADQYRQALKDFQLQEQKVKTQISSNEEKLKMLSWDDFIGKEQTDVQLELDQLVQANLKTETYYKGLLQQETEISPKLALNKGVLNQIEMQIAALEKEISENNSALATALSANHFNEIQEVEKILQQDIDVTETRRRLQQYQIEYGILQNSVAELSEKLKDFTFNESDFAALAEEFTLKEAEKNRAHETVVKLSAEIERLEHEFKKKEALLNDLDQVQKRAENLKIMYNLFKGSGFVQYASSIYLRQLCDHANLRFHRMTRNQLSLQLNDNNDFEIIDYLNEGRKRSVKTLSGGQAFQVSLSLALALAESVQAHSQAERNFFFIDEGFGTQDPDSVQVVFETLQRLQKEKRIVGIISHVEELKEKMPVSLNIIKDEMRGSLIEVL